MSVTIETTDVPEKESSIFIPLRLLGLFAVCLPTITVYLCIISTFFTHSDLISNYSISACPDVKSNLPPVSYSIGSWEPQKQLWTIVLILHFPARALILIMYPRNWTRFMWRLNFYVSAFLEILGFVFVSIFYVDSFAGFYVHAGSFTVWWAATVWVMSTVIHVQRVTGQIRQDAIMHRLWLAKIALLTAFVVVSVATSISYVLAQYNCSLTAFTIFILGEYTLIGLNAAFWHVVLIGFCRKFVGFRIVAIGAKRGSNKISPEIIPHSIICNINQSF